MYIYIRFIRNWFGFQQFAGKPNNLEWVCACIYVCMYVGPQWMHVCMYKIECVSFGVSVLMPLLKAQKRKHYLQLSKPYWSAMWRRTQKIWCGNSNWHGCAKLKHQRSRFDPCSFRACRFTCIPGLGWNPDWCMVQPCVCAVSVIVDVLQLTLPLKTF